MKELRPMVGALLHCVENSRTLERPAMYIIGKNLSRYIERNPALLVWMAHVLMDHIENDGSGD